MRFRNLILRKLANPERQVSFPFTVDFYGRPYSGNLTNFIDWTVFFYGAYSRHELMLLAQIASFIRASGKEVAFFDIGANIGHHSMFMSDRADRVFAFEPFAAVRSEMVRKLQQAKVNNVTIFPVALGDRTETGTFHPPVGSNTGTGTLGDWLPPNAAQEVIAVEVAKGDEFFEANNLPSISLLKMDVEGYESRVIEGLRCTLLRDRPPMLMEIQGPTRSGFETAERLQTLLYPNHLLFEVVSSRSQPYFALKPFDINRKDIVEALVLPAELEGFTRKSG